MDSIREILKRSFCAVLVLCSLHELVNMSFDMINLVKKQRDRIEYLAQEMREAEEKTFGIKFKKDPKIITSCHGNILYTLKGIKQDFYDSAKENYLTRGVILLLSPLITLRSVSRIGQYYPRENIIFINGGNAAIFANDNQLRGYIAHEEAHVYAEEKRKGLSKKIQEGLADYMAKKTLEKRGINYNPAYKKEYKHVSELMKNYKSIDEFLEKIEE